MGTVENIQAKTIDTLRAGIDAHQFDMLDLIEENAILRAQLNALQAWRNLSYRDPLTGLRNDTYLRQRIQEEIARCQRAPLQLFSVVVITIEGYRRISQQLTQHERDTLIIETASTITSLLREQDICCRTDVDEFTVLLPNTDGNGAFSLMQRIEFTDLSSHSNAQLPLSLRMGASTWPHDDTSAHGLLTVADSAVYTPAILAASA